MPHERLGGGAGFTWAKGMAEGGRITSTRTHNLFPLPQEDMPRTPSFPFIVRPAGVSYCKPQNGLGLTRCGAPFAIQPHASLLWVSCSPGGGGESGLAGPFPTARLPITASPASPGAAGSAGLARRKESLQPEQTLLAWNAPGNGMRGQVSRPRGSARRPRLTHPAGRSAEPGPHGCPAGRSRGREFADLGPRGRTLPESGPARRANERPRGGLGSPRAR